MWGNMGTTTWGLFVPMVIIGLDVLARLTIKQISFIGGCSQSD